MAIAQETNEARSPSALPPQSTAGHPVSRIFFGPIADQTRDGYVEKTQKITARQHTDDLARQIHANATIARAKFCWVQRALFILLVSVPVWLVALYLLHEGTQP